MTAREVLQKTYAHFQASADKQKLTIPIISGSPAIAFAKNHPQVLHNHKNHMLMQQNQHHGNLRMDGEAIAVCEQKLNNPNSSDVNSEPDGIGAPNSATLLSQARLQSLESGIVPPFSVNEAENSKK